MKCSLGISNFLKEISAKSLQSCPTLCNPTESSSPGSPIPGILQARTLEWVAISFSNAWKWKVKVKLLSCNPMDCSLPDFSVHGIFQARVLEWGAIAFSGRDLLFFPFYCFPLFLCTDHWGRLSYRSLLFFVTLHSNGYIFPFLFCFLLFFFSQLFVTPPQTAILVCCISFSW